MVTVRENAIRFEGTVSYQWAVDAQNAIISRCAAVKSAVGSSITAAKAGAKAKSRQVRRSAVRTHNRAAAAVRAFPASTRDHTAARLLGLSISDLNTLRTLASNPPAVSAAKVKRASKAVALDLPADGVNVDARTFAAAVHQALGAVSGRTSIPILGHILLTPTDGTLTLTATDLEIGCEVTIPAAVRHSDPMTVPAGLLAAALKSARGPVNIALGGDKVHVTVGGTVHALDSIIPEEFPTLPEVAVRSWVKFPGLAGLLKRMTSAVSIDESRAIITGVLIDGKSVCSTDTHRLFKYEHGMDLSGVLPEHGNGIIIPGRVCGMLARLLACKPDAEIELGCSESQVVFRCGDSVVKSRLIEGCFPSYEKVIPDCLDTPGSIIAEPGAMIAALESVARIAAENSNRVRFTVANDCVEVMAESGAAGKVETQFAAECSGWAVLDGSPFVCALSCRYMLDAVRQFKGDGRVRIAGSGAVNQFTFTSESDPAMLAVVMPMQVS